MVARRSFIKLRTILACACSKRSRQPALSSIEGFNRSAYQNEAGSNRSSRSIASLRSTQDQSVPVVPIVQSLCSVQNVSGIPETNVQRTQAGGRDAIEPLGLRHNRYRAPIAIFYRTTSLPGLVQAVQVVQSLRFVQNVQPKAVQRSKVQDFKVCARSAPLFALDFRGQKTLRSVRARLYDHLEPRSSIPISTAMGP
jgi:hypothetical protein